LFVGIDLPSAIDDHLAFVGGGIPGARWLDTDQLHITLRFIGEVDGGMQRRIEAALERVEHPVFSLSVAGVGAFPPRGEPRTLWAGVDDTAPLQALHERIERTLVRLGLDPEARNYTPHISLARLRRSPSRKVAEFMQHHALLRTASFEVDSFSLYSSVLSPRGSKYRIERDFGLRN